MSHGNWQNIPKFLSARAKIKMNIGKSLLKKGLCPVTVRVTMVTAPSDSKNVCTAGLKKKKKLIYWFISCKSLQDSTVPTHEHNRTFKYIVWYHTVHCTEHRWDCSRNVSVFFLWVLSNPVQVTTRHVFVSSESSVFWRLNGKLNRFRLKVAKCECTERDQRASLLKMSGVNCSHAKVFVGCRVNVVSGKRASASTEHLDMHNSFPLACI